ncbi:MAG: D-alanine--D-alanine ligase [Rickettsiales bacterium]|nr:D-alanine--D-alanine ligase [Rickettsiales bacterium]
MSAHVAVLKGGWSAEREVSLNSGAACAKALRELGYRVTEIDMGHDVAQVLAATKPDVVFNALHGRFGEDGCVQGMLDLMQIPYTHSGVLASSVAMDKPMAKILFESVGLRCAKGVVLAREELIKADPLPRPFVIKPADEGSSVGVHIVTESENRSLAMIIDDGAWRVEDAPTPTAHQVRYLVESYIPGREITVAVLSGRALGATEIQVKSGFYDYENKYTEGGSVHILPAPLEKAQYDEVMRLAEKAHKVLGCRGLSRSDFRFDGKDFYILEINTQPGMTALSLSPEIAAHAGISFNELVQALVKEAAYG